MRIIRNTIAVIAGYAVFAVSAVLLFQLSGVDPHGETSQSFKILTILYGMSFSFLGGWLAQLISKSNRLTINYFLAGIIAGFAAFSLFKSTGNHYSQYAAIFLFAPASLMGGLIYLKRLKH